MNTPKYLSDPYYSTSKLKKIPLLLSEKYCDIVFEDADTEQEQAANLLILQRVLGQVKLESRVEQKLNTSYFKPFCSSQDFDSYVMLAHNKAMMNNMGVARHNCDVTGDADMQFAAASNLITFCGITIPYIPENHVKDLVDYVVSWSARTTHIRYPGLRGAEIVLMPRRERGDTRFIYHCFIIYQGILVYHGIITEEIYEACRKYFPKIKMSKSDIPPSNIISVGDKIPCYSGIASGKRIPLQEMDMLIISDHTINEGSALYYKLRNSMALPIINSAYSPVSMLYSPLDSIMYYVNNSDESGKVSGTTDGLIIHRVDTGRYRLNEGSSLGSDELGCYRHYTGYDVYFESVDKEIKRMEDTLHFSSNH